MGNESGKTNIKYPNLKYFLSQCGKVYQKIQLIKELFQKMQKNLFNSTKLPKMVKARK